MKRASQFVAKRGMKRALLPARERTILSMSISCPNFVCASDVRRLWHLYPAVVDEVCALRQGADPVVALYHAECGVEGASLGVDG